MRYRTWEVQRYSRRRHHRKLRNARNSTRLTCSSAAPNQGAAVPSPSGDLQWQITTVQPDWHNGSKFFLPKLYKKPSKMTPSTIDRKSTRLNSSHVAISYAVFC